MYVEGLEFLGLQSPYRYVETRFTQPLSWFCPLGVGRGHWVHVTGCTCTPERELKKIGLI